MVGVKTFRDGIEEQFDLGAFMVPSAERDSKTDIGIATIFN